jgi:hypothetical protein
MGRLVAFDLADGESVIVEVGQSSAAPIVRGIDGSSVAEHARVTFEEAVRRIQPAVAGVIGQLRSLSDTPDEVRIEFGLDLHAEAGAFVAQASATANFLVSVAWYRAGTEGSHG